jgi:hypothetical protein
MVAIITFFHDLLQLTYGWLWFSRFWALGRVAPWMPLRLLFTEVSAGPCDNASCIKRAVGWV